MSKEWIGVLALLGVCHLVLVVVPIVETMKSKLSLESRLAWSLFLLLTPFIGVALFHFHYRVSLFRGEGWNISAADERARSGTLAPDDDHKKR